MRDSGTFGRKAILLGAIVVMTLGMLGYGTPVMAQDQKMPQVKEEVTVTGTLIPRPTLEAMAPVTTMDPEQLTYRGLTRLESLMQTMPQVFAAQNSTIANGASGTATVDLRYLGARRTLVLIDGKRQVAGDTGTNTAAPDLNFIPQFMIKRVDILTGGASSVYGADAVSGVVNFILNKDFNGLIGGITFGGYEHNNDNQVAQTINERKGFNVPSGQAWDGGALDINVGLGGSFADGKGHASGYAEYRTTSAVKKNRRDYTNCSVASLGATGPVCGGSGTIPDGQFQAYDADYNLTGIYTLDRSGPGNTFRPRVGTDVFNYAPYNYMQRPDQRWLGGGFVTYDWNRHFQGYLDVMLMDDVTNAQIAPSGDFGNTDLINCDNPMMSAQQRELLCTNAGFGPNDMANTVILKRNVEGGGRVDNLSHTAYRLVGGLKGEISPEWTYDVYGIQAETRIPEQYLNDLSVTRMQDALIVDGDPNDPSTWHCRSGNAGCVPWNLFQVGGITPDQLPYIQQTLISIGETKTQMVDLEVKGDLKNYGIAFPSASEGIQLALGADYRKEFSKFAPDAAYQAGEGSGQGGAGTPPVQGFYSVKELYIEGLFPLVQDVKGAKNLSVDLAYRYSDYNVNGQWPSYKFQAEYAPSSDFMFRAAYARANRAPNVNELYQPQGVDLAGTTDPCAGANPLYTAEQCARTGVPTDRYGHILANPAAQYNNLYGGNTQLTPETADTVTYGVVITPVGTSFTAALDYYDIKVDDAIGGLAFDDIVNSCAETGNPALCDLIHRDQAYTLWLFPTGYIDTRNANIGKLESEGIDVNLGYGLPAGNTFFNFKLIGTWLMKESINTGIYSYDCVQLYGNQCGVPTPNWRQMFTTTWETGPVVLSFAWRMVGGVWNDDTSPNPAIGNPNNIHALQVNNAYYIPVQNYYDLSFAYKFKFGMTFMLGVNNLLDTDPPLGVGSQDNDYGPGFYGTYDPYGRYIFSTVQFTF
jgi:iron complex outermembrane receptor protein